MNPDLTSKWLNLLNHHHKETFHQKKSKISGIRNLALSYRLCSHCLLLFVINVTVSFRGEDRSLFG